MSTLFVFRIFRLPGGFFVKILNHKFQTGVAPKTFFAKPFPANLGGFFGLDNCITCSIIYT